MRALYLELLQRSFIMKFTHYIFFIIYVFLLGLFFLMSSRTVEASNYGSGNVGIEEQWGIGYKIVDQDTVPLIAFDEDGIALDDDNHYVHPVNGTYYLDRGTVNIHVKDISDLFIVYDLYFGDNDSEQIDLNGDFFNPYHYFIDFTSGEEFLREDVRDYDNLKTFEFTDSNLVHGFFVNEFDGLASASTKHFVFNFRDMIEFDKRNRDVYEFSIRIQNSTNSFHTMAQRRVDLDIKVIVDNEKPQFYSPYVLITEPFDPTETIYTNQDFSFKPVDKVGGESNQISRYSAKRNGIILNRLPSMPQTVEGLFFSVPEITLTIDGVYDLEIEDLAGNVNTLRVVIDKTAPTIVLREKVTNRSVINNGAYANGVELIISDPSPEQRVKIGYEYNGVRQDEIILSGSSSYVVDDIFVNFGTYEILYIEDFFGNRTVLSNQATTIEFFIDNLGPFYDGNVLLYDETDVEYNTSDVRLKFYDDTNGSGIFTTMYYQKEGGVFVAKTLPSQDIFGYYRFQADAHHRVVVRDKALNELVIEFIIDQRAPMVEGYAGDFIYLEETTYLSFSDVISGIDLANSTYQYNNQQKTTLLISGHEIDKEGKYTFELKDGAGNTRDVVVYYDKSAPVITTQAKENGLEGDYYNERPVIIYEDGIYGSGIEKYYIEVEGAFVEVQKRDIDSFFTNRASGEYRFQVMDYMGFTSEVLVIRYDETKPELRSDLYEIEAVNYFNTFEMVFESIDDYTGIKTINIYAYDFIQETYVLRHGLQSDDTLLNKIVSQEVEGRYRIELIDRAGNISSYEVYFDNEGPTLENVTNFSYVTNWLEQTGYYFDDKISGIDKIEVSYEGGVYQEFLGFLTLINEGTYQFRVTDRAGNASRYTLLFDYKDPTIEGVIAGSIFNTQVTLVFEDSYSGFEYAEISLNGVMIETRYEPLTYTPEEDGTYEVVAYDAAGRSTKVTFAYDTKAPELEIETEAILNVEAGVTGYTGIEDIIIQGVRDETSEIVEAIYQYNGDETDAPYGMTLSQGTHVFEYEDAAGNRRVYEFYIDINDYPYIKVDGVKIETDVIYIKEATVFEAFDEISGVDTVKVDDVQVEGNALTIDENGTYVVKVTDQSGLESTYTVMYDDIGPTFMITLLDGVLKTSTFEVEDVDSGIWKLEYLKDDGVSYEMMTISEINEVLIVENGSYTLRLYDNAGNVETLTFVADIVYPDVTFIGEMYENQANTYVFTSEVVVDLSHATDIVGVEYIDKETLEVVAIEGDVLTEDGTYLIRVTNAFNNSSVYQITIDTTAIALETLDNTFLKTEYELEFGADYEEIARIEITYCEAYDAACEDVTGLYTLEQVMVFREEGKYTINVYDMYDNTSSLTFTIDKTAPSVTMNGEANVEIEYLSTYVEFGAEATDNFDDALTIQIDGEVDTSVLGTYVITYEVVDRSGNVSEKLTRTVEVVDKTAPIITLNGVSTYILEAGNPYEELGAIVTDNYDEDGFVTIGGDGVDHMTIGTYIITYDYTDTNGNAATTVTREMRVVDTIHPELIIIDDESEEALSVSQDNMILINVPFRVLYSDSGSGVQSVLINGTPYVDLPIISSGMYQIEVSDAANNKTLIDVLLDVTKPNILIDNNLQSGLQQVSIDGGSVITCRDAHTDVECYVNNTLLEEETFQLFIPGIYTVKAVDEVGNIMEVEVKVSLTFENVKSLFWYDFDNQQFKDILEILEYIKNEPRYKYEVTNVYSKNDLTSRIYDVRGEIEDPSNKQTFYLMTYNNINYAFTEATSLDAFMLNLINQDVDVKHYSGLDNYYEFREDYYTNDKDALEAYEGAYLEIRSIENEVLYEGIYKNSFEMTETRYQVTIRDERFEGFESFSFYLTYVSEDTLLFQITDVTNDMQVVIVDDQDTRQFQGDVQIEIGKYPFDSSVEVIEYNLLETVKNTIINDNRYEVASNESIVIGNTGAAGIPLENNKRYLITIYYFEASTNEVQSKTLELSLIDDSFEGVKITEKDLVTPKETTIYTIKVNEDTIDLYYFTEVYVEYCESKDACEAYKRIDIDSSRDDDEITIDQDKINNGAGFYTIVVKDNFNQIEKHVFEITGSGTNISLIAGLFLLLLALAGGVYFLIKKIR